MATDTSPSSPDIDFRHVFEDAPDAYLLLAPDPPDFTIQAASDAYLEATGTRRDEIVGRPVFEAFPDVSDEHSFRGVEESRRKMEKVIETGEPTSIGTFRFDIPHEDTDESVERYWSPRNIPIFDDDGELTHILHRVDEVTDLILQARYKRAGSGTPSPDDAKPTGRLLVVDPDSRERNFLTRLLETYWNVETAADAETALATLADYAPDLVVTAAELPDSSGLDLIERIKARDSALRVVLRLDTMHPEMYRRAFEAGADDVIGGQPLSRAYVSRLQAQLSAKELRKVLRERSEQQHRRLFMQAPVGIALLEGPDHVFTLSNPAYDDLVGNRALVDKRVHEAFPEPGLQELFDHLDDVYETGEPYTAREQLVQFDDPDGETRERYLTFAYLPFRDLDDEIAGVAVFAFDVTELVRMRKRSEQFAEQAHRESRRKDEFLAMLGHELRNPLTPIVHAAKLLEHTDDRETIEWASDTIDRQARQLTKLVDDLLDVSRINRGRLEIEPTECQLDEILEGAVETSRSTIEEENQHLEVDTPEPQVTLRVDRERLIQAVANLLDNATKYTPPAGHIWLEADVDGEMLTVEVRDDGEGIEESELSEVFELFSRSEAARRQPGGGLGVGLALVRQIVELHDGTVEAFSDGVDQGSRFVIELPVVVSTGEEEPTEPAEASVGQGPQVVAIEDNPDVAGALDRLLETLGADVRIAETGGDGLAAIEEVGPDMVLLDIGLPDMDGYEVARRLLDRETDRRPTLVALTGYGDGSNIERAREAGFDHFITKPASRQELSDLLESAA